MSFPDGRARAYVYCYTAITQEKKLKIAITTIMAANISGALIICYILCQVLSMNNLPLLFTKPLWDRYYYNSFVADGKLRLRVVKKLS